MRETSYRMDLENESIKDDTLIETDDIIPDDVVEVDEVEAEEGEESYAGAISANSEEEEIAAYMYQQEDWTL
jgi:hypothetical protein